MSMKNTVFKKRWLGMAALSLIGLGVTIVPLGCTVIGIRSGYEEAGYTRAEKHGKIEIRDYGELVVVETVVDANYKKAGNDAFRRLFRYISGNNEAREKIAMTTPVIADEGKGEKIAMTTPVIGEPTSEGTWRYMFVLPSSYTIETAPAPKDANVRLSVMPAHKVAAIRYAGRWKESTMRKKTAELEKWIQESEYEAVSEPRSAGYDPPWTIPPLRRNEVMIDLVKPSTK
jgi:hypothetical protein